MVAYKPNLSQDVVSDFLQREGFTPAGLWTIVQPYIDDTETAFISTKSYYLLKLADPYQETVFSDYRQVEGYAFPFATEINSKRGRLVINVFKISINPPVDEAIFKMPRF